MERKAWSVYDPVLDETVYLEVNPSEDSGSHGINKSIIYAAPISTFVSSSGHLKVDAMLIAEGPAERESFQYNGTVYTEAQFNMMRALSNKGYPVEMTDDLGRTFLVYITAFEPKRERSVKFKWKHTYTLAGLVIEELGV